MDSLNAITGRIKLEGLTLKAADVVQKLQQAGVFRAIVLQRQGNQVLLDTSFGRLSGKAPETLNRGDEITAKLLPNQKEPTVKVLQHSPRVLTLPATLIKPQLGADTTLPAVARVIASQNNATQLQLSNNTIKIPAQKLLQSGDQVLIQHHPKDQIRLERINVGNILKVALTSLLPRSDKTSQTLNLSTMQSLSAQLVNPDSTLLAKRLARKLTDLSQVKQEVPAQQSVKDKTPDIGEKTKVADVISKPTPATTGDSIKPLLARMALPLTNMQALNSQTLQQTLTFLSLIKPSAATAPTSYSESLPNTLNALTQLLKASPDVLRQLVREALPQQAAEARRHATMDRALTDVSQGFRQELLQQTEQTFNQLLTQKATLGLQLEQNQPIQVNLNLPVQVEQETRELKLKITEKAKQDAESEQHWEINLSFEFGGLGLISTHILLQDKRLSAHFWAVNSDTKNLIDTHMEQFKSQLVKNGFELGLFDSFIGQPNTKDQEDGKLSVVDNLLDVEA